MTGLRYARALPALLLLSLVGCGQDGGGPKLAPVNGKVLFKNQGVTAAEIYFIPDAEKGNQGTMAAAILQEDGSFALTTPKAGSRNPSNGVTPGAYKITLGLGRRNEPELKKYRDVKSTPLKVDVPEEGLKDYLIELK
jgi:hypothetical protein